MKELLAVDAAGWKAELANVRTEHYPQFGDRLPEELRSQLDAMLKSLG
jgi:phosphoenolpyruvate carboxykinase (GTP)